MNDLITRQQLAEQIPCALSVIDEARASGRLAYIQLRPGGKVFFRQEHIDAWLARLHTSGKATECCCNNLPQAQTERMVTQMAYYRTCPHCGANLDPGEVCEDCRTTERDAHQPTKQCERPYTNRPPERTVSLILHKPGHAVSASGKF
ncbi:MAG: hypothetical protein ACLSHJ_05940 [Oscillospiraceae bacterium]